MSELRGSAVGALLLGREMLCHQQRCLYWFHWGGCEHLQTRTQGKDEEIGEAELLSFSTWSPEHKYLSSVTLAALLLKFR